MSDGKEFTSPEVSDSTCVEECSCSQLVKGLNLCRHAPRCGDGSMGAKGGAEWRWDP
jgi:hypothetical protein